MNYLDVTEYLSYGLSASTDQAWVTAASAILDAHCRRPTLGVTQYEERLKMPAELNTVRLSYLPLVAVAPATTPIVSLQGRYGIPRRGEWPFPGDEPGICAGVCFAGILDRDRSFDH